MASNEEVQAEWRRIGDAHRAAGEGYQAALADYFAAVANHEPNASRLAPPSLRAGLAELDIQPVMALPPRTPRRAASDVSR